MLKLSAAEELRLMSKVSKLYYEDKLTQDEIVDQLGLSRSKVSRLLKQAREEGIVQITVIPPPGVYSDLEAQLERRFHLLEAVVVEVRQPFSQEGVSHEIGIAAANYFQQTVKDGDVVGISWGTTLSHMVSAMHPSHLPQTQIVQVIGGLGQPEAEIHATELSRRLARMLSCKLSLLPAPGIVDNLRTKEVYLSDSHVQKTIGQFSDINLAFIGIGAPTPSSVVMRDGSIITQTDLDDLFSHGAVGDIALRYYGSYGEPICSEVDERVIGITLEQLAKIKKVIGVSGGTQKKDALLGALRGGLLDVLITDQVTASILLSEYSTK